MRSKNDFFGRAGYDPGAMAPDANQAPEAPQTPAEALSRAEVREAVQPPKPRPALAYRARDLVEGRIAAAVDRTRADLAAALG